MKRFLQKSVLAGALVLTGLCVPDTAGTQTLLPARIQAQQNKAEQKAVKALTRLRVPLQMDVHGSVRWIEAAKGELSDKSMRHLPNLSQLEWLEIGGGNVTASGLAHLKHCVSLKRLYIHDIDLSNEELPWLSSLTKLEALSIHRTGVSGRVLRNVRAGDTLAVLNLTGSRISDEDMALVAGFRRLEVLALAHTGISGAGLAKLQGLTRLNQLNLIGCSRIVDADLRHLVTMPRLRILFTRGSGLSDMAIYDLKSKLQKLAVFR